MGSPLFRNLTRAAIGGRLSLLKHREDGFTLIELMATALIVVLIAAGVAQGLISGAHLSATQQKRAQADALAQQDQERLRGLSAKQLNGLSQTVAVSLDGTNFTVTSTATFLSSSGGAACGSSGPGAAAYYGSSSTVSWNGVNGTQNVKEESLITPPAGGSLMVKTVDQAGNPLSGVTVNATGPDVETGTTGTGGCVILAGLSDGDYNLSITNAGYVDPNSNPSPLTATASVTSSGTAAPSIGNPVVMGQAATLNVTGFTTVVGSGALSGQTADAVSWYGAGAAYSMQNSASKSSSPAGSPSPSFSGINNLFPFAFAGPTYSNDYQVWAGPCRQMQPPSGTDSVATGVTPGSNQSLTVQEPAITLLTAWGATSTNVQPYDIKMSFASTSGTSCTDSWSVPVQTNAALASSNGWLSTPGQPFASTATSGSTQSASGLTGTESVCVDYKSGSKYYKGTLTGFTNTNFGAPTTVTVPINSATSYFTPQC